MVMVLIGALLILITQADSVHTPAPSMREQAENGPERKRKPSNSPKKLPSKVDYDDTDELGLELVQGFVSMVRATPRPSSTSAMLIMNRTYLIKGSTCFYF